MATATPGSQRCGIKDYANFLNEALADHWHLDEIELPDSIESKAWKNTAVLAKQADLVLVHYEYGLFHSVKPYRNLFARFMKRLQQPAIVILHDLLPELTVSWRNQNPYRLRDALRNLAYLPFFLTWSGKIYGLANHYIVHAPHLFAKIRTLTPRTSVSFLQHPIPLTSKRWHREQPKKYTFISPGFIKEHKGFLDFLEVVKSRPPWTWLLAGGPQTDADRVFVNHLRTRIDQSGLTGRVTISGYHSREVMEEMMTQAELAVFPYQSVTGSGAVAWAVGMGMPIMVTDLDSFKALLQSGAGLALLPDDKPEQWPGLIEILLNDIERQKNLVRSNTTFSAHNSYDETARRITEIGNALLHQPEPRGQNRC